MRRDETRRDEARRRQQRRRRRRRRQGDGSGRRGLPACLPPFVPPSSLLQPPPSLLATSSRRLGGYTQRVNRFTALQTKPHSSKIRSRDGRHDCPPANVRLTCFFLLSFSFDSFYELLFFTLPSSRPPVSRVLAKTTRLRSKRAAIGGQTSPCSFHSAPLLPFSSPAPVSLSLSLSLSVFRSAFALCRPFVSLFLVHARQGSALPNTSAVSLSLARERPFSSFSHSQTERRRPGRSGDTRS